MAVSLPRNGRYELYCIARKVYCFDDESAAPIVESDELHNWIRQQPEDLWYAMQPPYHKITYYLQPELYLLYKLKWT